jgi:hypothetical protein
MNAFKETAAQLNRPDGTAVIAWRPLQSEDLRERHGTARATILKNAVGGRS